MRPPREEDKARPRKTTATVQFLERFRAARPRTKALNRHGHNRSMQVGPRKNRRTPNLDKFLGLAVKRALTSG